MPKQNELPAIEGPGVSPPRRIKAIDTAADVYVAARDARMTALQEEIKRRDRLLELMQDHKLTTYRFDDEEVEVLPGKTKVKVRRISEDGADKEDPDED
jgi:hypothetical protein